MEKWGIILVPTGELFWTYLGNYLGPTWEFLLALDNYNVVFKIMEYKRSGFEELQKIRLIESAMLSLVKNKNLYPLVDNTYDKD